MTLEQALFSHDLKMVSKFDWIEKQGVHIFSGD